MRKVNRYNLQYWIWVILNKQFGNQLKFKRSYVAHMYDVNKHDFEVFAATTEILKRAYDHLIASLEEAGYVRTCGAGMEYVKAFDGVLCYVYPSFTPDFYGKPLFTCTSATYKAL